MIQAEAAADEGEINHQRFDGWTLLHESILNGDGDAVDYLIRNKADVNLPAKDGWTPLHAAASGFVGNRGISIKTKEYSSYEIFRMVLESGADVKATTQDGWTPLHSAVANANTGWRQSESTTMNRIRDLINAGADLEEKDIHGRTPLHWAAMQGYSHYINETTTVESDVTELLIKAGANVNAIDSSGCTPLHHAVRMGYESISLALVKAGANISKADRQHTTPLDIARENQAASLVYILEHKTLPETAQTGSEDEKPTAVPDKEKELITAAISGDEQKVKKLLQEGVNVYYKDSDGFRAIDRARDNGYETIVELLAAAERSLGE